MALVTLAVLAPGCPLPDPPANLLFLGDADVILWGAVEEGDAGAAVAVDDQGWIALGAPGASSQNGAVPEVGAAYLVTGPDGLPDDTPLDDQQSSAVQHRRGSFPNGALGFTVAFAGDLDGSGATDLALAAPGVAATDGEEAGGQVEIYLDVALAGIGGRDPDLVLRGSTGHQYVGYALAGGIDLAGDGTDDLLVGVAETYGEAPYTDGEEGPGRAYLLPGRVDLVAALDGVDHLPDLPGAVVFAGENDGDGMGSAVGVLRDDPAAGPEASAVLLGAPQAGNHAEYGGAVYLCPAGGWDADGGTVPVSTECVSYLGEGFDHAGSAVAAAGDVDGSSHADLLIGAPQWPAERKQGGTGVVYLVLDPLVDLEQGSLPLDSGAATVFHGALDGDAVGFAVAGVGDLDRDGLDDLLIGAPQGAFHETEQYKGAAYLFTGVSGGFEAQVPVTSATIQLCGEQVERTGQYLNADMAGYSLAAGGYWGGDEQERFIAVGAPQRTNDVHAGDERPDAGAVYLLHDALEPYLDVGR